MSIRRVYGLKFDSENERIIHDKRRFPELAKVFKLIAHGNFIYKKRKWGKIDTFLIIDFLNTRYIII